MNNIWPTAYKYSAALILALFCNMVQATTSSITLNRTVIAAGETLEVYAEVNQVEENVLSDAYISFVSPAGTRYYYVNHSAGAVITAELTPFVQAWTIHSLERTKLIELIVPEGLAYGNYLWEVQLVKAGRSVNNSENIIASSSTVLNHGDSSAIELYPGDFSPPLGAITSDTGFSSEVIGIPIELPGNEQLPINVLTAGDIDDNLNYAAFSNYINTRLQENTALTQGQNTLPTFRLEDRVKLKVLDEAGRELTNARLEFSSIESGRSLLKSYTGSDGIFYLFPIFDGIDEKLLSLNISTNEQELFTVELDLSQLNNERELTINVSTLSSHLSQQLDLMFILDATGSMGDELNYLTAELRNIVSVISEKYPQLNIRYGLVVYRDVGDEYIVRSSAFTHSVNEMEALLQNQQASGGGDYPEAMEQGLEQALLAPWRTGNTSRLAFLVADAPAHDENSSRIFELTHIAREKGIHIHSLAASGVAETAEYLMRSISVLTQSRYLFLTDHSGIGNSHATPVVPCYQVTKLNASITRVIDSELAGQRIEASEGVIAEIGTQQSGVCNN
ncbi:MAG: VWA domain-containing protein [Methyloprofundus sp.]|nr:VWA domain-containing protein [Methyloprofundus sp.]